MGEFAHDEAQYRVAFYTDDTHLVDVSNIVKIDFNHYADAIDNMKRLQPSSQFCRLDGCGAVHCGHHSSRCSAPELSKSARRPGTVASRIDAGTPLRPRPKTAEAPVTGDKVHTRHVASASCSAVLQPPWNPSTVLRKETPVEALTMSLDAPL